MRLLLILFILTLCSLSRSHADGFIPPVNNNEGCTAVGQSMSYTGTGLIVCAVPQRVVATVGTLPTCNATYQGAMYMVTDANSPTILATVAAGGSITIGVTCNGTNWIVQ